MPATAGRVPMPLDNRIEGSRALETHAIWDTIGRDRFRGDDRAALLALEAEKEHLRSLTRVGSFWSSGPKRGACKKCNEDGHFTYQCRNFLNSELAKPVDDSGCLDSLSDSSSSDSSERRRRKKSRKKRKKNSGKTKEKKRKRKGERKRNNEETGVHPSDNIESGQSRKRERV